MQSFGLGLFQFKIVYSNVVNIGNRGSDIQSLC